MEYVAKAEHMVADWLKDVPHLPKAARTWGRDNLWWIVAIVAVVSVFGALGLLIDLFRALGYSSDPFASYYASSAFASWNATQIAVSLFFSVIGVILLATAVSPLKEKQKRGWSLLFAALLVDIIATVVGAVLTLNPITLVFQLIFGAIWFAVAAYFLFEFRGEFSHVERSKGAKKSKR